MSINKPYTIRLTDTAKSVYLGLARKARDAEQRGNQTSSHSTVLRMVDEALDKIIPHDPINKRYALAGRLSNIFRCRKGRMRIYWIASSAKREVYVLYISTTPRKEGDAEDPYEIFSRLVMSGKFNKMFERIGVKLPTEIDASGESVQIH